VTDRVKLLAYIRPFVIEGRMRPAPKPTPRRKKAVGGVSMKLGDLQSLELELISKVIGLNRTLEAERKEKEHHENIRRMNELCSAPDNADPKKAYDEANKREAELIDDLNAMVRVAIAFKDDQFLSPDDIAVWERLKSERDGVGA